MPGSIGSCFHSSHSIYKCSVNKVNLFIHKFIATGHVACWLKMQNASIVLCFLSLSNFVLPDMTLDMTFGWNTDEMLSYTRQSKRSKGEKFNISLWEKTTNVISFAIFIGLRIISDCDVKQ